MHFAPHDGRGPRSVPVARRSGQWEGPGGWQEALESEVARVFVEFDSAEVVSARRRRGLIERHVRGKVHTLRLVIPFKESRNVDGAATRKKARTTAGKVVSNGKIPGTFSATLAGETSQ